MTTLISIAMCLEIPAMFMAVGQKNKKLNIIGGIAIILVLILTAVTIETNIRASTQNADKIIGNSEITIYQDSKTGEYFRLIEDKWNIFHIYQREYIIAEDVQKLIDAIEITSKWKD